MVLSLKENGAVLWKWYYFTWRRYTLRVAQWALWYLLLMQFLKGGFFRDHLYAAEVFCLQSPWLGWYLIYLAARTPGFCWSTSLLGSSCSSSFLRWGPFENYLWLIPFQKDLTWPKSTCVCPYPKCWNNKPFLMQFFPLFCLHQGHYLYFFLGCEACARPCVPKFYGKKSSLWLFFWSSHHHIREGKNILFLSPLGNTKQKLPLLIFIL